jgi:hypothetical protein
VVTEGLEVLAASIIRAMIHLMAKTAGTSETSVIFQQTTRCQQPEDSHLQCRENQKSTRNLFHALHHELRQDYQIVQFMSACETNLLVSSSNFQNIS